MHGSKQHQEVTIGVHEYPAQLQSFLETSTRYFGLAVVPHELLDRHAVTTCKETGSEYELTENQYVTNRSAA